MKSDYYESPLRYHNVDWYVSEIIKIEIKIIFNFKNTSKDIIMTQEDKEDFDNNSFCRFCEKKIF